MTSGAGETNLTTMAVVRMSLIELIRLRSRHVCLPNGPGLDYAKDAGTLERVGVPPKELTSLDQRDWLAGTGWHKWVPARIDAAEADQ